ncbi:polymeric immunoglobulin receptor-like isoform X3 [Phaenicophaeus curvirostris]|uniref:polymeric immunoglobulin receptor-like isoform X3 n=1 Tax=Phaenicophaeus curvirostris TaxID=33595 RepID=UPI0037F0B258
MELRALLLLPLCFPALQAQAPHDEERKPEGSTLQIQCPYTQEVDQRRKAWCRMTEGQCEVLALTKIPIYYPFITQDTKGKVTLKDNGTYRILYVTMTNLQPQDSGTYACVYVIGNSNYFLLKTISLNVFRALQARPPDAEERWSEGSTLQIQCPYMAWAAERKKGWCRVKDDECELLGEMLDPTQQPDRTRATNGKVTIADISWNTSLSITMTNLQVEDAGTYSCVYHSNNSRYIPLKMISLKVFKALQARAPDAEERWSEGSTLQIQCPYTAWAAERKKGWCRVKDDECELLGEMLDPTQQPNRTRATNGKVTIADISWNTSLSITMTNLQVEDSGTYACAYRSNRSRYIPLKTITLKVFKALQARPPDAEERWSEGSTLQIQCPYMAWAAERKKGWCRVKDDECELLGEMLDPTQQPNRTRATNGKVTISDIRWNTSLSITMTNLQVEDAGTYSCVYRSDNSRYIPLKTISLRVFKELYKTELDRLSVRCPYSKQEYGRRPKAWCRRGGQTPCTPVARTDFPSTRHNIKDLKARSTIQDDTQNSTITITMEKLQAQDTGMYWCALYEYPAPTWIMEVSLSVSKRIQQRTAKEMDDVSVQCRYSTTDYGAVSKAWCKEGETEVCTILVTTNKKSYRNHHAPQQDRFRIQDDTQQGIVTITMEKLQAQDSGIYWCALDEKGQLFRMEEVTLNISEALPETTLSNTSESVPPGSTPAPSSDVNTFILLSVVLSILFILALISLITLGIRCRKQQKRRGNRQEEDTYSKPEDTAQLYSSERRESPKDDSKDLKYATLDFKSKPKPKPIPEDSLYCNVEPSQACRKPQDEYVEYAVIALKQLPTNNKG